MTAGEVNISSSIVKIPGESMDRLEAVFHLEVDLIIVF